ncbi:hypothetical protein [Pseudokordiimonas caeni]|uniref:hypothetical protein n=1 Tax=Pseudokordiimonas caeni TaxID=2997908 RepID=UPI002810DB66|nr:hypothetical protein [Pseudokordiimonas caeni]
MWGKLDRLIQGYRDTSLVFLGGLAGTTLGAFPLLVLTKGVGLEAEAVFEGLATMLTGFAAVVAVGYQVNKSIEMNRKNFQFKILHDHRKIFVRLLNNYNEEEESRRRAYEDGSVCDEEIKFYENDEMGTLLSFSSKVGLIAMDLGNGFRRVEGMDFSDPEVKSQVSEDINFIFGKGKLFIDLLYEAVFKNELPDFEQVDANLLSQRF